MHKFKKTLLGFFFVFHVNHMALVYFFNKPRVSRRITKWLLLFLGYEFTKVYKPSITHAVDDVLFKLLDSSEPLGVSDQTKDTSLFSVEPIWM